MIYIKLSIRKEFLFNYKYFSCILQDVLYHFSYRMWIKCRAMRDVEVKLPPGLAPPDAPDTVRYLLHVFFTVIYESKYDITITIQYAT